VVAHNKLRGVNLGGWLVLEPWLTPSLFAGTGCDDEFSLSQKLGQNVSKLLDKHRRNFITAADFAWISKQGLNAIRLPVGYWAFGGAKPYLEHLKYIDFAFDQAGLHNLKVILDLHGAPGSQNGKFHSGRAGRTNWPIEANIEKSLAVVEKFARRYGHHPNLIAIEVLNEPDKHLSLTVLGDYYERAAKLVRSYGAPGLAVVINDAYKPHKWLNNLSVNPGSLWFDLHLYQLDSWLDQHLILFS
jgi:glucan 1,3-beta-glucosidase